MTINYATLEATKFWPCLLPSAEYVSPGLGATAEVMNLTRLPPNLLVRLQDVGAQRSVDAELRLKADSETFNVPAAALPALVDTEKKTGTADFDAANKLHDTGEFLSGAIWVVGRRVFNVTDGTWGWVKARDDDDTLSIMDAAGADLDLFPDGDEDYVIEPAVIKTEPTQYDLLATKSARLQVYGVAALTNYKVWHNLLVTKATIADKIALGIPLTAEEKSINEELGISKTVDRGTLPIWDFERYKLYEYRVLYKETRTIYKDVPATGILVDTIRPRRIGDQFIVLEKVSCDTTAVGDAVKLTIARDDDGSRASPLLTLNCYSMALSFDIPCFIPALREINLWLEAGALQTAYKMRYTYSVMKLSNLLRMRFGIMAKENNLDLWKRVKGGIV